MQERWKANYEAAAAEKAIKNQEHRAKTRAAKARRLGELRARIAVHATEEAGIRAKIELLEVQAANLQAELDEEDA